MAEVKGRLDALMIFTKHAEVNGKNAVTSVNGVFTKTNDIDLTKFGNLKIKGDVNDINSTEIFYANTSTINKPVDVDEFNIFNINSLVQKNSLLFSDDVYYFSSSNNKWQMLASKDYVDNAVNTGEVVLSDYLKKDDAKTLYLPITSNKDATVGTLTSTSFIKLKNDTKSYSFMAGNELTLTGSTNDNVDYVARFPSYYGVVAYQEWVNKMIYVSDKTTYIRNPNGTPRLCLVANDAAEAGVYDSGNKRWSIMHNGTSMYTYGNIKVESNTDYTWILLQKQDKRYLSFETVPHTTPNIMGNFIYREDATTIINQVSLPRENGILATREFINQYVTNSAGGGSQLVAPNGQSSIAVNPNGNTGFWDLPNKRWMLVANPNNPSLTVNSDISIHTGFNGSTSSKLEITSPNNERKVGLFAYDDGKIHLSSFSSGVWYNHQLNGSTFESAGALVGQGEVVCKTNEVTRLHLKTALGHPEFVYKKDGTTWSNLLLPITNTTRTIATVEETMRSAGIINFGGSEGKWTTAEFLSFLSTQNAFNGKGWVARGSWSYANNRVIDTGMGLISLAGSVVKVFGSATTQCTIQITVPTTTTGGSEPSLDWTYINNGPQYLPGWRNNKSNTNLNTALKSANGWWQCGSTGIIYQWGSHSWSSGQSLTFGFVKPFPNNVFSIQITDNAGYQPMGTRDRTKNGFTLVGNQSALSFTYLAIGF